MATSELTSNLTQQCRLGIYRAGSLSKYGSLYLRPDKNLMESDEKLREIFSRSKYDPCILSPFDKWELDSYYNLKKLGEEDLLSDFTTLLFYFKPTIILNDNEQASSSKVKLVIRKNFFKTKKDLVRSLLSIKVKMLSREEQFEGSKKKVFCKLKKTIDLPVDWIKNGQLGTFYFTPSDYFKGTKVLEGNLSKRRSAIKDYVLLNFKLYKPFFEFLRKRINFSLQDDLEVSNEQMNEFIEIAPRLVAALDNDINENSFLSMNWDHANLRLSSIRSNNDRVSKMVRSMQLKERKSYNLIVSRIVLLFLENLADMYSGLNTYNLNIFFIHLEVLIFPLPNAFMSIDKDKYLEKFASCFDDYFEIHAKEINGRCIFGPADRNKLTLKNSKEFYQQNKDEFIENILKIIRNFKSQIKKDQFSDNNLTLYYYLLFIMQYKSFTILASEDPLDKTFYERGDRTAIIDLLLEKLIKEDSDLLSIFFGDAAAEDGSEEDVRNFDSEDEEKESFRRDEGASQKVDFSPKSNSRKKTQEIPRERKFRKLISILERNGFYEKRTRGSHKIFQHVEDKKGRNVVIPRSSSGQIKPGTLSKIQEQANTILKDVG